MNRQLGFNIIELMVTIAVLGVLLGVGVPGVQALIQNNRLTSQINMLSTSLALARSEAIKLNQRVLVCVSTNGTACASSSTTWDKGWMVFVDRNENGAVNAGGLGTDGCATGATADCIVAVQSAFVGTNTLTPGIDVTTMVAYIGDGSARCDTNGDLATLESCINSDTYFTLCDFRGATHAKGLAISNTGRVTSVTKKPNGSAFTCP